MAFSITFADVVPWVLPHLSIRDLRAVEVASRDAWVASSTTKAWETLRRTQFRWANSTARFLLDVSASKKRGVLGLLAEVNREVRVPVPHHCHARACPHSYPRTP